MTYRVEESQIHVNDRDESRRVQHGLTEVQRARGCIHDYVRSAGGAGVCRFCGDYISRGEL